MKLAEETVETIFSVFLKYAATDRCFFVSMEDWKKKQVTQSSRTTMF